MKPTASLLRRLATLEHRAGQLASREDLSAVVAAMRRTIPLSSESEPDAIAAAAALPPRWRPHRFHAQQGAAFASSARFRAIECGRRSGKTEGRKREAVIAALDPDWPLDDRFVVVGAPTQHQAMRLYWRDLLRLLPPWTVHAVRKSEFEIELVNGALLRVLGMDRPERAEGEPIDHLFLDEFADLRGDVLEHLRPALDTRDRPPGRLTAFGTTDMRSGDAFIKLCDDWRNAAAAGDRSYSYHHWTSQDVVSAAAWDEAKRTLDPVVFAVEYEARRVSTGNRAYYMFDRDVHCVAGLRLIADRPLLVCCDWNWDPGTAVIAQEQARTDYHPIVSGRWGPAVGSSFTAILGEIFMRRTNTPSVMRSVLAWIEAKGHKGSVHLHGDPAGGAQGSARVDGSDLDLVRKVLGPALGSRLSLCFATRAPAVVARLNAMNARLRNAAGEVRVLVDPTAAPELVRDLEIVSLKDGAMHVELDKPTTEPGKLRTHLSDALGYYVAAAHPVREVGGSSTVDD